MTRDELRAWLDRPPPPRWNMFGVDGWQHWYDPVTGEYLGARSPRTGPDPVDAKQRCLCGQCSQQTDVQRGTMEQEKP